MPPSRPHTAYPLVGFLTSQSGVAQFSKSPSRPCSAAARTPAEAKTRGASYRSSARPCTGGVNGGYFDAGTNVVSNTLMIGIGASGDVKCPKTDDTVVFSAQW